MLGYCTLIAIFILGSLATCQYAALIKFWPYNLELGLKNYQFDLVDGGGDLESSGTLARALKEAGVALIDCSSGATTATAGASA